MSTIANIDDELPRTARPKINTNFSNLNTDKQEKAVGAATNNFAKFGSGNVLQDSGKNSSSFETANANIQAHIAITSGNPHGVSDANLATTDVTNNDVSTSKHGFVPKAPNDITKFFRGDGVWAVIVSFFNKIYNAYLNFTLSNSTTETTVFTCTVPGGTLGTANAIKITVNVNTINFNSTNTLILRLKYGGTTIVTSAAMQGAAVDYAVILTASILANAATNAQQGNYRLLAIQQGKGTAQNVIADRSSGSAAVDSTVDQTLAMTAQWSAASSGNVLNIDSVIVEAVRI